MAASLAGITPTGLAFLAFHLAEFEDHALTIFLGADRPLFDPFECQGLRAVLSVELKGNHS